ncbi:MAG: hypothetical protein ACFCUO_05405 [Rhodospirillales bacterium]
MKLDSSQIDQIEVLIGVQPMPENHPVIDDLTAAFGEHTFYLSEEGLVIWEWLEGPDTDGQPVVAVVLAAWIDDEKSSLQTHQPKVTEFVIPLAPIPPTAIV